ncbi:MAG: hypothetical protein GY733_08920, partial [bacterium]|nr:hypothetical protein [bacterium]
MRRPTSRAATDKAVRKYLERHAEPEAKAGAQLAEPASPFAAILVIPAYGEAASLWQTLEGVPACAAGRVCIVIVVNERADTPAWARDANARTLERLRSHCVHELDAGVSSGTHGEHDLVLIDRTAQRALPARQGVGLARKIGADFALGLWASAGCQTSWIHCSDADARLPADYFDRTHPPAAALLYDFRHEGGPAILEYEIYLRYAVLGLHAAGSPWAWHAIGSTLALDAHTYAQVRGFPRREAAEDFHLLAKLAKVGPVRPLRGEPIRLCDRTSTRVPFGTGRAMREASERRGRGEPLRVPDPRNYTWLAAGLDSLGRVAREPGLSVADAVQAAARKRKLDPQLLARALGSIGALEATEKLIANRGDLHRSLNENFDALATLRLLHALRDAVHPDVAL